MYYVLYVNGRKIARYHAWQTAYAGARMYLRALGDPDAIANVYKSNGGTIFTGLAAFDARGVNVTRQIAV